MVSAAKHKRKAPTSKPAHNCPQRLKTPKKIIKMNQNHHLSQCQRKKSNKHTVTPHHLTTSFYPLTHKQLPTLRSYSFPTNTPLSPTPFPPPPSLSLGCTTCRPLHPLIKWLSPLRTVYCTQSGNPLSRGATPHTTSGNIKCPLLPLNTALTISSATVSGYSAEPWNPSNSFVRVYP